MANWNVDFSTKAGKQYRQLKRSGSKPSINDLIDLFVLDLQRKGPNLPDWPHYSPLEEGYFHCHLHRGNPTYVACWRVLDKKTKQIEVYYVGTHQGAPY